MFLFLFFRRWGGLDRQFVVWVQARVCVCVLVLFFCCKWGHLNIAAYLKGCCAFSHLDSPTQNPLVTPRLWVTWGPSGCQGNVSPAATTLRVYPAVLEKAFLSRYPVVLPLDSALLLHFKADVLD